MLKELLRNECFEVDNTDAEGRLILADGLSYASELNPYCVIDVATLTGSVFEALGAAASAVFTNDEQLFQSLQKVLFDCINYLRIDA